MRPTFCRLWSAHAPRDGKRHQEQKDQTRSGRALSGTVDNAQNKGNTSSEAS